MIEETLQFAVQASGNAESALQGITVALRDQQRSWDILSNKLPWISAALSGAIMAITEATRRYLEASGRQAELMAESSEDAYMLDRALKQQGRSLNELVPLYDRINQAREEEARGQRSEFANRLRLMGVIEKNSDIFRDEITLMLSMGRTLNQSGGDVALFDRAQREMTVGGKEAALALSDFQKGVANGTIDLGKYRAEFRRLSPLMLAMTKAGREVGSATRDIGNVITEIAAPAITDLLQIMARVLRGIHDWIKGWAPVLQSLMRVGTYIKAVFLVIFEDLMKLLSGVGRAISILLTPLKLLGRAVLSVGRFFGDMVINAGKFFEKIKEWVGPLNILTYPFRVLAKAAEVVQREVKEAEKASDHMTNNLKEKLNDMGNYGRDLFGEMVNQILNMPERAVPPLMALLKQQVKTIENIVGAEDAAAIGRGAAIPAVGIHGGKPQIVVLRLTGELGAMLEVASAGANVRVETAME